MKIRNYLLISFQLFVCCVGSYAQSYNYESEFGHESYKSDGGVQRSVSRIGIKYFPAEIRFDNKVPFTELAFMQRKNSYAVSLASMQYQDSNFAATHVPVIGFGVRAIDAAVLLEINYNQSDKKFPLKVNQDQYYDMKNKSFEINYGWYVLENTSIGLSVGKKIISYSAGPGLTPINDSQRSSNGIISHSVIDFYHGQQLVLDLSFKLEKSQLKDQSKLKNHAKEIKIKYFPIPEFYVLGGGGKSVGSDSIYVGNSKVFGLGFAPRSNLNFLINKEIFTIYNSDQGASHSNASVSMIYKF